MQTNQNAAAARFARALAAAVCVLTSMMGGQNTDNTHATHMTVRWVLNNTTCNQACLGLAAPPQLGCNCMHACIQAALLCHNRHKGATICSHTTSLITQTPHHTTQRTTHNSTQHAIPSQLPLHIVGCQDECSCCHPSEPYTHLSGCLPPRDRAPASLLHPATCAASWFRHQHRLAVSCPAAAGHLRRCCRRRQLLVRQSAAVAPHTAAVADGTLPAIAADWLVAVLRPRSDTLAHNALAVRAAAAAARLGVSASAAALQCVGVCGINRRMRMCDWVCSGRPELMTQLELGRSGGTLLTQTKDLCCSVQVLVVLIDC